MYKEPVEYLKHIRDESSYIPSVIKSDKTPEQMKNSMWFLLLPLLLIGCKKENNVIPDYRDKFIGDYKCSKTGVYHCGDSTFYYDTTVIIAITKANDSLINILDVALNISANGEFGGGLYPVPAYHGFGGYFINDSVFFNTYIGGLGCFTSLNYKGKKISQD